MNLIAWVLPYHNIQAGRKSGTVKQFIQVVRRSITKVECVMKKSRS